LFDVTFASEAKLIALQAFAIDKYAVSNTQFQKFVRETKHKTDAEEFQWSFVLDYLAPKAVVEEVQNCLGEIMPHYRSEITTTPSYKQYH